MISMALMMEIRVTHLGEKRESHKPKGMDSIRTVNCGAAPRRPSRTGVRLSSSRMLGRNRPRVSMTRYPHMWMAIQVRMTAQP